MRLVALVGLVATSAAFAAAAATSATRETVVIVPGVSIGKIKLGMTLEQVKAALGKQQSVVRREELAFGGEYVELAWAFGAWTVGLQGRAGKLRVIRIATTKPTQRTKTGLGSGSKILAILKAFPKASCIIRDLNNPFPGTWVVVEHANGNMTAFSIQNNDLGHGVTHLVQETVVQERWINKPFQLECPAEWRGW